jgi:hypothetical protein
LEESFEELGGLVYHHTSLWKASGVARRHSDPS